jgi:hypothetical protein
MKALAFLAALVVAAALAACGGDGDASGDTGGALLPAAATGPGISIEEALEAGSDEPLLVNGNLLILEGQPRLCSALAESFPPQCGGASLLVTGLSLAGLDGLNSEGEVTWTDRPIKLLGVVSDGVLTVSDNAS